MSKEALPCITCHKRLDNSLNTESNQPSEGTSFRTFGHYGSTFWDSLDGEEIVISICDECLKKNTDKILRQKRFVRIQCEGWDVGRQWVDREAVPYFKGPEDHDVMQVDVNEIGTLRSSKIEWASNWEDIKKNIVKQYEIEENR